MNNEKIIRSLLIVVPVLLLLSIVWHAFAPFLSLAILYLMILVFRSSWVRNIFNWQQVS